MRLLLVLVLISLNVNATVVPKITTFLQDVDEACKPDVERYNTEITKDFHRHIILMEMDNIDSDLNLRELLIDEGAITSQRVLDANLLIKINSILKYEKLDDNIKKSFTAIKQKLATHPLAVDLS
ncbi:hypothetical protein E2K93_11890 [Thalassotalea sp. HSM 43]|uniref:hypothetical protein n=1 Tax=Thalassotalea sp. HSM 43 TaxID=2552945 RepID=UPI00107FD7D8|nr:hypothetical protein [Thalassotalea sp. HSM 43]QBY05043.1 hypothetical protein E2K93_11890 [Thalassotalea sp. HSM 43]